MSKLSKWSKSSKPTRTHVLSLLALVPVLAAHAQYVGKVEQGGEKKPVLRATAVYEYTGSITKPNASRLVPVVVWDGEHYEPGGLYLAKPEPLAVAPGTQYLLQQSGIPAGIFDVSSAGQLGSFWVGLGRVRPEAPALPPAKLKASKTLPVLTGSSGKGKVEKVDDGSGPVLHRKAGSEGEPAPGGANAGGGTADKTAGTAPNSGAGSAPGADPDRPTLHRRDPETGGSGNGSANGSAGGPANGSASGSTNGSTNGSAEASSGSSSPAPDPDRPTLHRKDTANGADTPGAPDPDRPTLHRHADSTVATTTAPDPDRPHLRYGQVQEEARVLPVELKDIVGSAPAASDSASTAPAPVKIGQVVAISDTEFDDAHPFAYTWPSPAAQTAAQTALHGLALGALNKAAQATFGPAAQSDAALRKAAATNAASFGPGTKAVHKRMTSPAAAGSSTDPLLDPQFQAYELSYGGGTTYVYTAHTASTGHDRRYVTIIAQADFYGKPQVVFSQTTQGDTLHETPALHLIDAADVTGNHRAELLFDEQVTEPTLASAGGSVPPGRNFALFSVAGGQATEVYTSWNPNAAP